MRSNTPPRSPNPAGARSSDDEGDFDIGDIEEVIELNNDNFDPEEIAEALVAAASGTQPDQDQDQDQDEDMEDEEVVTDMATTVFSAHKGSVFTCDISPDGTLAATGGEDDLAYVWTLDDGSVLFTCTGHKDSVTHVCFSHDGKLLATGDYDGNIQVWDVQTAGKIWEFEVGQLGWLAWHRASHVLLAGTGDGELWLWLVPQGHTRTLPGHGSPSLCGAFLNDGKRAVSGYEDGSVRVFDLKTGQVLQQVTAAEGQDAAPVINIDTQRDDALILFGSTDGIARLANTNNGKLVGSLNCEVVEGGGSGGGDADHTVEAASFCPHTPNIAVTATLAGHVTIWDVSSKVERHRISQGCGSSFLAWHPHEPVFYTAGLDGTVRSYDVRSGEALQQYTGHRQSILAFSITSDGSRLVTTSDDSTVRVFKLS